MAGAIAAKTLTYDFKRLMGSAKLLKYWRRDYREYVIRAAVILERD
jgi:hypothetical protein